jgi:hypothetical protein
MDEIADDELRNYVRQFLYEFKALIYEKGLIVQERQINRTHLLELGLTKSQREEIVLSLTVLDYNSGPIKDEYKPGHYWVFGRRIEGSDVYIKLKIAGYPGSEHAVCLSFHKAERPMDFPFEE